MFACLNLLTSCFRCITSFNICFRTTSLLECCACAIICTKIKGCFTSTTNAISTSASNCYHSVFDETERGDIELGGADGHAVVDHH
jgi:hypothetical protein